MCSSILKGYLDCLLVSMKNKKLKQLPQNLKSLLQDIGENAVLFNIFTQINQTDWKAFKNLDEAGCDIVLLNLKTNNIKKIEVKTRQSIYSSAAKMANSKSFQLTKLEYKSMDYLVCYWFNYNDYFIIPKKDINGNKTTVRVRIGRDKNGNYGAYEIYRNKWNILVNSLTKSR